MDLKGRPGPRQGSTTRGGFSFLERIQAFDLQMRAISGPIIQLYAELMRCVKTLASPMLAMGEYANNRSWQHAKEALAHPTINENIHFEVRERKDGSKYEMKIYARCVHESPCFRLDSAGPTHDNIFPDVPLPLRPVPTPHFQRFDHRGRWLAYHTESLRSLENRELLSRDIELGLIHFCEEALISSEPFAPAIYFSEISLDLREDGVHDMHAGTLFP